VRFLPEGAAARTQTGDRFCLTPDAYASCRIGGATELRRDTRGGPVRANSHPNWQERFFYGPFVFFERAFNPVHVLAVSIEHRGYNSVIATSLPAEE